MAVRAQRGWWWLSALIVGAALLRTASVVGARDASWDEDTFILVAQRLAMGELPFTTTFENKPPLFSVLLALPQLLAPDSRLAVRLALAAVIVLTAMLVHATVRGATGSSFAGATAGLTFAGVSALAPSGEAWMSQHSANLWVALLLLLLRVERRRPVQSVLTGVIAAVLVLTRTNYAIPAAALILLRVLRQPPGERPAALAWLCAGGAIPTAAVLAAYGLAGEVPALLAGVFEILVADGGQGDLRAGLQLPPPWLVSTAGLLVALGAAAWPGGKAEEDGARSLWWMNVQLTVLMGVSVLLHQSIFTHYLLMFAVPLGVLGGLAGRVTLRYALALHRFEPNRWRSRSSAAVQVSLILLAVGVLARPAGLDPARLVPDARGSEQVLHDGVANTMNQYLTDRPGRVWALTDHYVYWRTGTLPPHPLVTHPSSLVKQEFWASVPMDDTIRPTTAREAIDLVLAIEPRYVVSSEELDEWYLNGLPADDRAHLAEHLEREYRIVWRSAADVVIRERRSSG